MKLKVRGLEDVKAQLRSVSAELGAKALGQAVRASFLKVVEAAKAKAPVDSGGLRDAISVAVVKPKGSDTVAAAGLVVRSSTTRSRQATMAAAAFGEAQRRTLPPSRRWHFAELGTAKQAATPFIRPALDSNATAVVDDLAGHLRKKIATALKKKGK